MLRRKILIFEYLFGLYFLLQTLLPKQFTLPSTLVGFGILSFNKFHFEGLRLAYLVISIIQVFLLIFTSLPIRLALVALTFLVTFYYPMYKHPNPTGKYRVGYKMLKIDGPQGPTSMGVYYPTTERTRDVKYAPTKKSWERFADFTRFFAEMQKGVKFPKLVFRIIFNFLERQHLGLNQDATIIKSEKGAFPVVVFSHGLSANIHIYSVQLKEWASYGFIVFSVDHDEEIDLKLTMPRSEEEHLTKRGTQLAIRKKIIKKVLDLISEPSYAQKLFGDQSVTLNYGKVFLAGHSFGGGTTAEVASEDKRATGGLLLLDPWFEACDEKILFKPIDKPILSLRSSVFNRLPRLRDRVVKHTEENIKNKGGVISGFFKNSVHNSSVDLIFLMPREMSFFKEVRDVNDVENQARFHVMLTRMFLESALEFDDAGNKDAQYVKKTTLETFRAKVKELGKEDTLILDN